MRENYINMKVLLEKTNSSQYSWHICDDLRAAIMLNGLQEGCNSFFMRIGQSRRTSFTPGVKNVSQESSIQTTLHMRLDLIKKSVKAMNEQV